MPASFTLMTCALRPKTRLTTKMAAIPMMTVSHTQNGTFMHKPPAIRDDVEHRRSLPPAGRRPGTGGAGGSGQGPAVLTTPPRMGILPSTCFQCPTTAGLADRHAPPAVAAA